MIYTLLIKSKWLVIAAISVAFFYFRDVFIINMIVGGLLCNILGNFVLKSRTNFLQPRY